MAQKSCKSFRWMFNGRIGLWKLQLYCTAVNGMQLYKKNSEMPSVKHSEASAALAAFNESKWCSTEGDFAVLTKTSSMNWVKSNQMLQDNLQKRKLLLHCTLDKQVLLHAEIPQYCNNSEWPVEYLDAFGNKKSSVLGWANFGIKAWFMDKECHMLAVPHTQRVFIPSVCLYFYRWSTTYT